MNLLVLSSCQTALTINNVFTFSFNIGVLTVLLLNSSGPLLMECSSAEWYRMVHRYKKYNCKKNSFQSQILSSAHFVSELRTVLGLFERILGFIVLSSLLIFLFWSAVMLLS